MEYKCFVNIKLAELKPELGADVYIVLICSNKYSWAVEKLMLWICSPQHYSILFFGTTHCTGV